MPSTPPFSAMPLSGFSPDMPTGLALQDCLECFRWWGALGDRQEGLPPPGGNVSPIRPLDRTLFSGTQPWGGFFLNRRHSELRAVIRALPNAGPASVLAHGRLSRVEVESVSCGIKRDASFGLALNSSGQGLTRAFLGV